VRGRARGALDVGSGGQCPFGSWHGWIDRQHERIVGRPDERTVTET
jgi:hypothetical protein